MRKIFPLLLLLLVSVLTARAFFLSGFIPTHDGEYHIVRQWQFSQAIYDGQLLPVWAGDLNNGYGVPIFEFFYPLPGYVAHFFVIFGSSFIDSIKLTLALGLVFSAFTFYLWARCFFKPLPAIVGSVAYILAPYHTVDMSIRGSVGEVWALAISPFVFFAVTKLLKEKNYAGYLVLFSISATLLLISHNVVGLLFYILVAVYGLLFCYFYKKSYWLVLVGTIYSLALSTFFWLPLVFESSWVTGLHINNYYEHFPSFLQLIFPSWGTGFSVPGPADQMSFQIGLVHILAVVSAIIISIRQRNFFILSITIIFIGSIFLMLEWSNFIWLAFSSLKIMQFPWRFLSVSILLSSFLISFICGQNKKVAWTFLVLSFIFYFSYTMPVIYLPREDGRYIEDPEWISGTTTWGNTFKTRDFSPPEIISAEEFRIVSGEGKITEVLRTSARSESEIIASAPMVIEVKRAYFPGWEAFVDNNKVEITPVNGIIRFNVPPGEHEVSVVFGSSTVRLQAVLITVLSFIALILYTHTFWIELPRRIAHKIRK